MTRIYEDANDQHVRKIVFFGKTADHKLYDGSDYKKQITQKELEDAFKKGMLLIYDGTSYMNAVSITANKALTVAGTTTVAGTEWAAKAE